MFRVSTNGIQAPVGSQACAWLGQPRTGCSAALISSFVQFLASEELDQAIESEVVKEKVSSSRDSLVIQAANHEADADSRVSRDIPLAFCYGTTITG
jgi:hypothetical protein